MKFKNMECPINNKAVLKNKNSICYHHLVNCCVYVPDFHTRLGLIIDLMTEGYYMRNAKHINQLIGYIINGNQMVYINDDEICVGGILSRHSNNNEIQEELERHSKKYRSSDEDIHLFLNDYEKFQKQEADKYEREYGWRPEEKTYKLRIDCGTNKEMFECLAIMRDDDNIYDKDERKKRGIYEFNRLFVHAAKGDDFIRFSNMQDFDPEKYITDDKKKSGMYFRIATLEDILKVYKQGVYEI